MVRYTAICLVALIVGAALGAVGGLSLGWLLALSYHRHGPSDPGDAPVYVAIGLTMLASFAGALVGLAGGIVISVRQYRQEFSGNPVSRA